MLQDLKEIKGLILNKKSDSMYKRVADTLFIVRTFTCLLVCQGDTLKQYGLFMVHVDQLSAMNSPCVLCTSIPITLVCTCTLYCAMS